MGQIYGLKNATVGGLGGKLFLLAIPLYWPQSCNSPKTYNRTIIDSQPLLPEFGGVSALAASDVTVEQGVHPKEPRRHRLPVGFSNRSQADSGEPTTGCSAKSACRK